MTCKLWLAKYRMQTFFWTSSKRVPKQCNFTRKNERERIYLFRLAYSQLLQLLFQLKEYNQEKQDLLGINRKISALKNKKNLFLSHFLRCQNSLPEKCFTFGTTRKATTQVVGYNFVPTNWTWTWGATNSPNLNSLTSSFHLKLKSFQALIEATTCQKSSLQTFIN